MTENEDTFRGFVLATTAYMLWGFLPVYLKALDHIPAVEVVAHRIVWSVPVAGVILLATGRTRDLFAALRSPRTILLAMLTATLITINWAIYVWAIGSGHALDAALGYYINPLFSVLVGAVVLKERLSVAQGLAVALAALAVGVLTWETGRLPLVALGLTFSWGAYAFCKKSLPIGPNQGFLLEVLLLTPPALAYLGWLSAGGASHFLAGPASDTWLLLGCGVVTAVPLIVYANSAKLLRLSTIGILQYITPTMIFLTALIVFREEFGTARMIAFPMIWIALVIYTASLLRQSRKRRIRPTPV